MASRRIFHILPLKMSIFAQEACQTSLWPENVNWKKRTLCILRWCLPLGIVEQTHQSFLFHLTPLDVFHQQQRVSCLLSALRRCSMKTPLRRLVQPDHLSKLLRDKSRSPRSLVGRDRPLKHHQVVSHSIRLLRRKLQKRQPPFPHPSHPHLL